MSKHTTSGVAVSPFNRPGSDEDPYPTTTEIYDGTIRKILLTPGTGVSIDGILKIRDALLEAGVQHMLVNVDWQSGSEPNTLEAATAQALLRDLGDLDLTVYSDSIIPYANYDLATYEKHGKEIVDTLASWGATCVAPPMFDPVDPTRRASQLESVHSMISYASSNDLHPVMGFADVGRTDFEYLVATIRTALDAGANRVDLYDSYCSLSPEGLERFVAALRTEVGSVPMMLHTHDDFGTASSTAIKAATLGLLPDVAVNGASYRAGFAALEEVVAALEFQYGINTGIETAKLTALSATVAELSGLPIHPLKSVTGPNQWVRGGNAAVGLLRDGQASLEGKSGCFAARTVGAEYWPIWDHRTNSFAIAGKLDLLGLPNDPATVQRAESLLAERLAAIDTYPRWLEDGAMDEVCAEAAAQPAVR